MFMAASCVQPKATDNQSGDNQPIGVEAENETVQADPVEFKDFGPEPTVIDIEQYTLQNETFTRLYGPKLCR